MASLHPPLTERIPAQLAQFLFLSGAMSTMHGAAFSRPKGARGSVNINAPLSMQAVLRQGKMDARAAKSGRQRRRKGGEMGTLREEADIARRRPFPAQAARVCFSVGEVRESREE